MLTAATAGASPAQSTITDLSADDLFNQAFNRPRSPRSDEYKAGVRAALKFRINGTPLPTPYKFGSVQDDAYYSGQQEGHAIWRSALSDDQNYCVPPTPANAHASYMTSGGAQ